DRQGDGAGTGSALPRRAVRGARPGLGDRARRADPGPQRAARPDLRGRHPRPREHLQDRQELHHARPGKQEHHRPRRSAGPARHQHRCARPLIFQPGLREGEVMSAPTNRWKLGAFVVGSLVVGVIAAVIVTAQTMQAVTVTYTSYFDEAVTGLEVGSPVRYRGVKIGNVSGIDVAPDQRHVEIIYSLGVKVLDRLGLAGSSHGKETRILLPPTLRVQLASTGLTGTKYLQIDFFDGGGTPPPVLPFPVPENYI